MVDEGVYTAIAAHWAAIQAATVKLEMLRKQIADLMMQLSSLNRALTYDEVGHSTRQDRDAWDDARRWMRNASTQLSRCQKACDVGDTQSVGKRDWRQNIHDNFIVTRQPIDNIQLTRRRTARRTRSRTPRPSPRPSPRSRTEPSRGAP